MKKICLIVLAIFAASFAASAQISEGQPTTKKVFTGNRPNQGTWGLYIGTSSDQLAAIIDGDVEFKGLPIINFKYMASNKLELRIGLDMYNEGDKTKGKTTSSEFVDKNSTGHFHVSPGFAYHFSKHNILDVYAGAELPLGFENSKRINTVGGAGDIYSRFSPTIGIGAFIGLQAFIGNLPLALGVEYGISANTQFGQQYKHQVVTSNTKQVYYSSDAYSSGGYDKLSISDKVLGNQVRVTISYYFK